VSEPQGKRMSTNVVDLRPAAAAQQRSKELTSAIGMMVALGSWTMMFGALFFVFLALRDQAISWPPPGLELPMVLPTVNTVVIVVSSFTLAHALKQLRGGEHRASLRWMLTTFVLGLAFVVLQIVLWRDMWNDGITTSTGTLGTVVYGLTGLHALHVAAGVVVLGYLVAVARRRSSDVPNRQQHVISLRLCGMFWHFVDVVWILMFLGMFVT